MPKKSQYVRNLEAENTFLKYELRKHEGCSLSEKQIRRLPRINPEKTGPRSEEWRNKKLYAEFWRRRTAGERPQKIISDLLRKKNRKHFCFPGDEITLKKIVYSKKKYS